MQTNLIVGDYYGPIAAQYYLEIAGNPNDEDFNYADMLSQLVGDYSFVCPSLAFAR